MSNSAAIATSADADAFMRRYLSRPTDATARLVFADWLEETCVPHNVAWAYYIRLKAEADQHDYDSRERRELDRQAGEYVPKIRANLTIPARLFVGYPKSLLQLLPAPNITVKLKGFTPSLEVKRVVANQMAQLYRVFPLAIQDGVLLIAHAHRKSLEVICDDLSNLLCVSIIPVFARNAELSRALAVHYPVFLHVSSALF